LFVGKCQKWQIRYDMQNSYIRSIIIINFITSRFSREVVIKANPTMKQELELMAFEMHDCSALLYLMEVMT
jgi:hypothetical protein